MTFQIHALDPAPFAKFFDMDDATLARHKAIRMVVDAAPGFPCRVTLEDAPLGSEVILINHTHLQSTSPYTAAHAIYVRKDAVMATPAAGTVPDVMRTRLCSVRGFDADDMLRHADVVDGADLAQTLTAFFDRPQVAYVHIHNAKQGCFAARATREGE